MRTDLDQAVEDVLARRRRDLTVDELEALDMALRVGCPPPPRGCQARAGVECRSIAPGDEGPLVHQLFHVARGRAGGVAWMPTTSHELAGTPKRKSMEVRAREHYESTGRDLPGFRRGVRNNGEGW